MWNYRIFKVIELYFKIILIAICGYLVVIAETKTDITISLILLALYVFNFLYDDKQKK